MPSLRPDAGSPATVSVESAVKLKACPNRMYLQISGEGDQVERATSRRLHEDSSPSRRFPRFHLKNRRTFALFTKWGGDKFSGIKYVLDEREAALRQLELEA